VVINSIRHSAPRFTCSCITRLVGLPEKLEQVLVRVREMEHQRPCPRHEEQVNPHQGLEDPARCGGSGSVALCGRETSPDGP
jgi:hypothetical protein